MSVNKHILVIIREVNQQFHIEIPSTTTIMQLMEFIQQAGYLSNYNLSEYCGFLINNDSILLSQRNSTIDEIFQQHNLNDNQTFTFIRGADFLNKKQELDQQQVMRSQIKSQIKFKVTVNSSKVEPVNPKSEVIDVQPIGYTQDIKVSQQFQSNDILQQNGPLEQSFNSNYKLYETVVNSQVIQQQIQLLDTYKVGMCRIDIFINNLRVVKYLRNFEQQYVATLITVLQEYFMDEVAYNYEIVNSANKKPQQTLNYLDIQQQDRYYLKIYRFNSEFYQFKMTNVQLQYPQCILELTLAYVEDLKKPVKLALILKQQCPYIAQDWTELIPTPYNQIQPNLQVIQNNKIIQEFHLIPEVTQTRTELILKLFPGSPQITSGAVIQIQIN